MNPRTYHAPSMARALEKVKRELGPDAVILHTRMVRRGGFLGIGRRKVVEVIASDQVNAPPRRRRPSRGGRATHNGGAKRQAPQPSRAAAGGAGLLAQTYGVSTNPPEPQARMPRSTQEPTRTPDHSPQTREAKPQPSPDPDLSGEVREIRRMVHRMMRTQGTGPRSELPEQLFNQYLALIEQEVAEELAEDVVLSVCRTLEPDQLSNEQAVKDAVGRELAKMMPVARQPLTGTQTADGRPMTIALVGPTGVGKTTTIAKLAATLKLRRGLDVALLTIDTYRIAAVDQLRTYANIIGVPVHVALSSDELSEAMSRCRSHDVVLIDTAGRSQRNDERLDQLRAYLEVANPHEVHLVLSSNCSQRVMMEAAQRFSQVRIDRIIFTKVDEAVTFGVLLNVARQVNKQLSYLSKGQEVPHDIETGSADRVAGLIMGKGM